MWQQQQQQDSRVGDAGLQDVLVDSGKLISLTHESRRPQRFCLVWSISEDAMCRISIHTLTAQQHSPADDAFDFAGQ
jgi:hypothetical protein